MYLYLFITIAILVVSFVLVLIVLVQNSKGGGLASGFASTNQIMGANRTPDIVEKITWSLTGSLFVLCIIASLVIPRDNLTEKSEVGGKIQSEYVPGFEINEGQTVDPNQAITPPSEDPNY